MCPGLQTSKYAGNHRNAGVHVVTDVCAQRFSKQRQSSPIKYSNSANWPSFGLPTLHPASFKHRILSLRLQSKVTSGCGTPGANILR